MSSVLVTDGRMPLSLLRYSLVHTVNRCQQKFQLMPSVARSLCSSRASGIQCSHDTDCIRSTTVMWSAVTVSEFTVKRFRQCCSKYSVTDYTNKHKYLSSALLRNWCNANHALGRDTAHCWPKCRPTRRLHRCRTTLAKWCNFIPSIKLPRTPLNAVHPQVHCVRREDGTNASALVWRMPLTQTTANHAM